MNILVVSSYLPYPLFSGGHIRLYNLLKELSEKHEITLVCEKRPHQTLDDVAELKKICKEVFTVDRKKQWSLKNILMAGFSSLPFLLIGHKSNEMKDIISRLLKENSFDLIHAETFYIMHNIPETHLPVVLAEHNIEYLVYKRYTKTAPFFLRPLLYLDIAKLTYWEKFFWKKATRLISVSEEEKVHMKRSDIEIVPNGVDISKFTMKKSNTKIDSFEETILFIGDFKWIQNRDSIVWILKEIWPTLNSKLKNLNSQFSLKLWIVGRNIPDDIKKLTDDKNVIFDEKAPKETEKIFEGSDILLSPIRVGGGTSYKILESMASGIPVITTPLGKEGLLVTPGKDVLIGNSSDEIVSEILELLTNEKKYEEIRNNARKVIEQYYDWKIIGKKLGDVYESVIKLKD